ncbi:hypothetical protein FKM82_020100 [Ascaphus truei]
MFVPLPPVPGYMFVPLPHIPGYMFVSPPPCPRMFGCIPSPRVIEKCLYTVSIWKAFSERWRVYTARAGYVAGRKKSRTENIMREIKGSVFLVVLYSGWFYDACANQK